MYKQSRATGRRVVPASAVEVQADRDLQSLAGEVERRGCGTTGISLRAPRVIAYLGAQRSAAAGGNGLAAQVIA